MGSTCFTTELQVLKTKLSILGMVKEKTGNNFFIEAVISFSTIVWGLLTSTLIRYSSQKVNLVIKVEEVEFGHMDM